MWYKFSHKYIQSQRDKKQPSLFFDSWAEGNDIKEGGSDYPMTLYHGTLSPRDQFILPSHSDTMLGKNVIFTTTSPDDANKYYSNVSSNDWKGKIEDQVQKLKEFYEVWPDSFKKEFNLPEDMGKDEIEDFIQEQARRILNIQHPMSIPLYGRMHNPANLKKDSPLSYSYYEPDFFEYRKEDDENYQIPDFSGYTPLETLVEEMEYILGENTHLNQKRIDAKISEILTNLEKYVDEDGLFSDRDLYLAIQDTELYLYDEEYSDGEFVKDLFEQLGKDGIILNAYEHFPNMYEYMQDVDHYIFFNPTQLKSQIGNSGLYDPNSPKLID